MHSASGRLRRLALTAAAASGVMLVMLASTAAAQAYTDTYPAAPVSVTWLPGYPSPGTPASLDKVGVIEVGQPSAKNVLVLEPGTQAAGAYFVPFAKWVAATLPNWQVWAVVRRESLLEDQSELNLAKQGMATAQQVYDYYLGWLTNPDDTSHIQLTADSGVGYARKWGVSVAVHDLRTVIEAAHQRGGQVVLGGHSLGGAVVTAYATWDFNGVPGADGLAGLVYDDGGSAPTPAPTAQQALQALVSSAFSSPWLELGGIPAPFLGLLAETGSISALLDPNGASILQNFPFLPSVIDPPVPATNLAAFGYAVNTATSPAALAFAQAHLGSLATGGTPVGWDSTGALTPIDRYAEMFSGWGLNNLDGIEWYFPARLALDTFAVADGNANGAQLVLGLQSTLGSELPHSLRIYAFGAWGGQSVLDDATTLASQSGIPSSNLTLINENGVYAHNDPAGAYPNNAFYNGLVTFLDKLG